MNNMKEIKENQKSGKGWNEDADPTCINKKGKIVARRHHDVAAKGELKNTLRTPLFAPLKSRDKEDEELAEEIVEEVQENRSESAVSKGIARTVENVGDRDDAEDLVSRFKNPNKSDLKEVDTDEGEEEQ